jgi:hypothetical protein
LQIKVLVIENPNAAAQKMSMGDAHRYRLTPLWGLVADAE